MALSSKVKAWFQKKHGYSLDDAFEITEAQARARSDAHIRELDAENMRLAERLARKTGHERHTPNPTP